MAPRSSRGRCATPVAAAPLAAAAAARGTLFAAFKGAAQVQAPP